MSTGNSIQGSVGVDLSNLRRDFQEAERVATQGGAKLEQTIKRTAASASRAMRPVNWNNVYAGTGLIDPVAERRRRNSAAGFAPARAGQYPAPEGGNKGGIRALLNEAGIGRLFTVYRLATFARDLTKDILDAPAKQATQLTEFNRSVAPSFSRGAFRGSGEIDQDIGSLREQLAKNEAERRPQTESGAFKRFFNSGYVPGGRKAQDAQSDDQRQQIIAAITRDLGAQVEKQRSLTELQSEAMSGSERQAAILRSQLEYKERIGEIDERYKNLPNGGPARQKLQEEAANQNVTDLAIIKRRFDLKDAETRSEVRLGFLRKTNIGAEAASIATLRERIALKNKELEAPMTNERRDEVSAERLGMEAQLNNILRERQRNLTQTRLQGQLGQMRANGGGFGANLFSTFIGARQPILDARRNRNGGLAQELAGQAATDVTSSLADEIQKSPAERRSERAAQRARARAMATAGAQIKDAQQRKENGAYHQTGDKGAEAGTTIDKIYSLLQGVLQ